MKEFHYTIKAANGIHAVPACKLSAEVRKFSSKITMEKNGKIIDMMDLMGLMGLNVKQNDVIVLRAEGSDEQEAIAVIATIMETDL